MLSFIFAAISFVSGLVTIHQAWSAKKSAKMADDTAKSIKGLLRNNQQIETTAVLKHSFTEAVTQLRKLSPGVTLDKIKGINIYEISRSVSIFTEKLSANWSVIFNKKFDFEQFNNSVTDLLNQLSSSNSDIEKQQNGTSLYLHLNAISNLIHSKSIEHINDTNKIGE